MKVDIEWIKSAEEALITSGIIENETYPKAYKGYISSLSASIIQSGLVPALSIYENDNSGEDLSADNNRALLIYAIVLTLQAKKLIPDGLHLLSSYVANNVNTDLHRNINRALIAMKLAIRIYKPEEKVCGNLIPADTEELFTKQQIIHDNYNYDPDENYESNIGWLYYKDLYRNFRQFQYKNDSHKDITVQHEEKLFKQKIGTICRSHLNSFVDLNKRILQLTSPECGFTSFTLKTIYPGLLTGIGLSHGVKCKGDIKVGFQFDFTTGLPYIPGSSIKGALRSVFPDPNIRDESYNEPRISYLSSLLIDTLKINNLSKDNILLLGQQIFQESDDDTLRDVFMDALITDVASATSLTIKDYFIGNDYITPHKISPLHEPIPIQFLKVLPEVTFTFTFRLSPVCSLLTPQQRKKLYKEILKDIGIGAKTNVGYGHFRE